MDLSLSEWANIATIITALGVVGIALQVLFSHRQIKADHERSRREKSVEVLIEWSKNLKKEGSLARKIIECLNEEQCREVYNQNETRVSKKHITLLVQLFGDKLQENDNEGDYITLTEAQTTELRWHVITYLNSLEFTLVAWQYAVVDKDIIESQFSFLFRPADGHELLKHFRKAAGGEDTYPAIEIFTAHLEQKRKEKLIEKAKVA